MTWRRPQLPALQTGQPDTDRLLSSWRAPLNSALEALGGVLSVDRGGTGRAGIKRLASTTPWQVQTEAIVYVDATSGNARVVLPAGTKLGFGEAIGVSKRDSTANTVTVAAPFGVLINGAATYVQTVQYEATVFRWDGTGWSVW